MHFQLARGAALVALVLLKHGENKPFLELAYGFRVEDIALVHLHDEGFKLILHSVSLSFGRSCQLLDRSGYDVPEIALAD